MKKGTNAAGKAGLGITFDERDNCLNDWAALN